MKIVIHAIAARKHGGSTVVLEGTARGLAAVAPENEYVICVNPRAELTVPSAFRSIEVDVTSARARLKWDNVDYPRLLRAERADIAVGALGFSALRPPIPQVSILQDSTFFCRYASIGRTSRQRLGVALRRAMLKSVCRASRVTVVPSRAMQEGARRVFGRVDTRVIRDAWEGARMPPRAGDWASPVKLLYLSHLESHKAHLHLVDIASALTERGIECRITIAVDRDDAPGLFDALMREIRVRNVSDSFSVLPRQSPGGVSDLLEEADCVVYPSLCESFGYPMVEAVSAGLPVIAADTPINREMLGPGALYFPPLDPAVGACEIERLVTDRNLRESLPVSGQAHQESILFGWDEYARRLNEVLDEVAAS